MIQLSVYDLPRIHLPIVYSCLLGPNMNSDRNQSPVGGGHAAERQPLLPSPLSANGHPNTDTAFDTAVDTGGVVADGSGINTLVESRTKLGASALNFFLSGIAMAAVGVSITPRTYNSEPC